MVTQHPRQPASPVPAGIASTSRTPHTPDGCPVAVPPRSTAGAPARSGQRHPAVQERRVFFQPIENRLPLHPVAP
jgi:hypothetical protein